MNIKETLLTLQSYYLATRTCGYTTSLLNGAVNSADCRVLVDRTQTGNALPKMKGRTVNLNVNNLANSLIGVRSPLLIDNSALLDIIGGSITEIERLERKIERLQKKEATPSDQEVEQPPQTEQQAAG